MSNQFGGSALNQKTIAGHPVGLFVLFFTEMWERFSYYGMRAILVLFLTSSILDEGWAWEREDALELYAWYTGLVYLTPIFGGLIARLCLIKSMTLSQKEENLIDWFLKTSISIWKRIPKKPNWR